MRLRQTLLVYLVPLMLLPALLFGVLAIKFSQSFYWQQANLKASSFLQQQQLAIHTELMQLSIQLQDLTSSGQLMDYLAAERAEPQLLLEQWQRRLQPFAAQQASIKLVRLNGATELVWPIISDTLPSARFQQRHLARLQGMIQEELLFFATEADASEPRLFIARKVYNPSAANSDTRQLWGYLVLSLEPEAVRTILQQSLTPSSISLIISPAATIAFSDRLPLIGSTFAPSHFRTIQQSIQQQDMVPGTLLGQPMLLKGAELPGGFQLLLGINQQELMAATRFQPWVIGALLVAIMLLLPFSIYGLLIRHVFNPIRKLTQAKTAVGRGDLSTLLPVSKQDELGDMFAAFNVMVRQLRVYRERERAYKQQLEDKVLKRTQDLARANDDLAAANQELIVARETAEQASRLKSVFLANMSHEIRTPLTAIIGFSEQSVQTENPEQIKDYQLRVLKSSQHLLNLINDILDLSKIEADKLELQRQPYCCLEIIDDVYQLSLTQAKAKGLDCELQLRFPLPKQIVGDEVRFRQVLLNLASNAIKFTEQGRVLIRVEYELMAQQLKISVKDTGIGIAPAELSRLFQPFVQADATVTRHFGGTGLGLCISKKLIQQMGGDIRVDSVKGVGSNFEVILDCTGMSIELVQSYQAPQPQQPAALVNEQCPLHILVAEDNPDNQLLLGILLQQVNASYVMAVNGHEAVEKALSEDFDLIFMDMQMPTMGGEEATGLIRHAGINTPIIAVTANVMSEDIERYKASGCQDVLSKPIDQQQFLKLVQSYRPDQPQSDHLEFERRLAEDPVVQALKNNFRERLPDLVQQLVQSSAAERWQQLAFDAHSLKGSAGSMGFQQLTELAAELELQAQQQSAQACQQLVTRMEQIVLEELTDV